jgi:hypothetical protein
MPTRADIEAATPRCDRRIIVRNPANPRSGTHHTCGQPMRYLASRNAWVCRCGGSQHESQLASRRIYAAFT